MNKIALQTVSVLFVLMALNCGYDNEEENCDYMPQDCTTTSFDSNFIEVNVSQGIATGSPEVIVYKGIIDDGIELIRNRQLHEREIYKVPNGYISVKTIYSIVYRGDSIRINSVDGSAIASKSDHYCEGECYEQSTTILKTTLDTSLLRQ